MLYKVVVVLGLAALILSPAIPALAEITAETFEAGVHVGWISGGDLTDTTVSGSTPELDGGLAWGCNANYNFTTNWAVEGRYTWEMSEATNTPTDTDMNVHLLDLNAVYHFNPEAQSVFYATAGLGWAFADLDNSITGTVNSVTESISDGDGFTFNVGGGVKYFMTEKVILRGDVRYRYMNELVSAYEEPLNTIEITGGVGYKF